MAELNRLFFALWPQDVVRAVFDGVARDLKLRMQPGGFMTAAELYHLTLLFLGDEVSADQQAKACQIASRLQAAPFTLCMNHADHFRTPNGIHWWLGPREKPDGLDAFYKRLRRDLTDGGVALQRMRFVPHLTLFRNAQHALPDTAIKPVSWEINEFVLIRSHLQQRPVSYELLGRWPLNGRPESGAKDQLALF